jgi:RHS repeat-associated protein
VLAFTFGDPADGLYGYLSQDNLGSTRRLRIDDKSSAGAAEYSPYGDAYQGGEFGIGQGFTGHLAFGTRGNTSAAYFAPYRVYDSALARWMSRDPLGTASGLNVYAYVSDNPVNIVDPLGQYGKEHGRYEFFDTYRPPTDQRYTLMHFPLIEPNNVLHDSVEECDALRFMDHMHIMQDYYSHTASGVNPLTHITEIKYEGDDPDNPDQGRTERGKKLLYDQMRDTTRWWELQWLGNRECGGELPVYYHRSTATGVEVGAGVLSDLQIRLMTELGYTFEWPPPTPP